MLVFSQKALRLHKDVRRFSRLCKSYFLQTIPSRFCEPSIFLDVFCVADITILPVFLQLILVYGLLDRISSETVKRIYQTNFPFFGVFAVCQHLLKVFTVIVCTRHNAVDIFVNDIPIVSRRKFIANSKLTFDRLLGLSVARITSINYTIFHSN